MTSNDQKIAKIELMFATGAYQKPIVPISGSQRLEVIEKIMQGRG
tara:strand:+ start:132 stop:266 length:135 start_codon:yes stop_codon:yes gene_type:complete